MKNKQESRPLVTIIIPAYNVREYISECVQSILNQNYRNLEVIVVDDGSTDDTGKLCDALSDSRLSVIHKKNGGLVSARKRGLAQATGAYVGFVDGDDYVEPCFVSNLVNAIEDTKADFVHAGYCEFDENGVYECSGRFEKQFLLEDDNARIRFLNEYVFSKGSICWITNSIWSKMFTRELIQDCYSSVPDSQSYGEDLINLIRCVMRCTKIATINNTDYRYRIRANSMTHLDKKELFYKEIELCNQIREMDVVVNSESLSESVYNFLRNKVEDVWMQTASYYFENEALLTNKRIVIYGAGRVGVDYYTQLNGICQDVRMVDRNFENIGIDNVYNPKTIRDIEADYVLIAVEKEEIASEIMIDLGEMGIPKEKILWSAPMKS